MKRQGFLLGLFSVGGQVLLLRELVSSLNGDELFIGTALFGWLIAVALGAYWGGRSLRPKNPNILIVVGAVMLPVMVAVVKLSPLMATSVSGEVVPFVKAALISVIAMFPIGIISGRLFPLITRNILFPSSDAVVKVYLYEGIGAFVGGMFIFLMVITNEATLVTAVGIDVLIFGILLSTGGVIRRSVVILGIIFCIAFAVDIFWPADSLLVMTRHSSYKLKTGIYSPYGHHMILERDGSVILMDDNSIEGVYPDPETAENHFLIPFIYHPSAENPAYVGCAYFIAPSLSNRNLPSPVYEIDPRRRLPRLINQHVFGRDPFKIIGQATDAVDYFTSSKNMSFYDVVILNSGLPDSYHNSRYFTPQFLQAVKSKMTDSSILSIPLAYDTDRYLTPETQDVLSVIYSTLSTVFANVTVWPGTTTIFLASDRVPLNLTADEIIGRLNDYKLNGDYISDAYLYDRLSDMRVERLLGAISGDGSINTISKPILTHYQALYRATAHPSDRMMISFILGWSWWLLIIPLVIIFVFWRSYRADDPPAFGQFLYFTAGVVSLSLELISFYLYQTMAGSLYSEMSLLIGTFMLGLAVGTYYAHKVGDGPLHFPALIILLIATLIFLTTWNKVGTDTLLIFHALFLFVVAVATGTLFVGATNLYYRDSHETNRGLGYAWELAGSALGALLTMTVLLPIIGLTWLLISLAAVIVLALVGAMMPRKQIPWY